MNVESMLGLRSVADVYDWVNVCIFSIWNPECCVGCTVVVVAVVASQSGRQGQRWVGGKYSLWLGDAVSKSHDRLENNIWGTFDGGRGGVMALSSHLVPLNVHPPSATMIGKIGHIEMEIWGWYWTCVSRSHKAKVGLKLTGDEKECCCEPYRGIGNCSPVELVSLTTYEQRMVRERGYGWENDISR